MIPSAADHAADILASDGATVHRLTLRQSNAGGAPVLVDAAGTAVSPWTMELLRWPAAAETDLRRGGYLIDRCWTLEPWCNCAD